METTRKIDAKAARRKRRLIREWITYAVICAFLAGVNALTTPHYWWVLWVMAGWGLGLILDLIFHLTNSRTMTMRSDPPTVGPHEKTRFPIRSDNSPKSFGARDAL